MIKSAENIGCTCSLCEQSAIERYNIKEWKALELQITQARHPLSTSGGKMSMFKSPKIRKYLSNVHIIKAAHVQCMSNHSAKFEYKGMKTVRVKESI